MRQEQERDGAKHGARQDNYQEEEEEENDDDRNNDDGSREKASMQKGFIYGPPMGVR